jgi:hypothetical protein
MPNFPGKQAYPLLAFPAVMIDVGTITYSVPTGIARGVTTPDYNARLRGKSTRNDVIPQPPYP